MGVPRPSENTTEKYYLRKQTAAVDVEAGSGDEGGFVRNQAGYQIGYFPLGECRHRLEQEIAGSEGRQLYVLQQDAVAVQAIDINVLADLFHMVLD